MVEVPVAHDHGIDLGRIECQEALIPRAVYLTPDIGRDPFPFAVKHGLVNPLLQVDLCLLVLVRQS